MTFTLDRAKPHTIKKFEIISEYVDAWARKILGFPKSEGIVYVDCMSNSGYYYDVDGNVVEGTAVRVAKRLNSLAENYPGKTVSVIFNDIDPEKINYLKEKIESLSLSNISITYYKKDCAELLNRLKLSTLRNRNLLLVYDPFQARIHWDALTKYLNFWGEVIINHMVSDTARGAKTAVKHEKIAKYESTYKMPIKEIIDICDDREKLDERVKSIIGDLVKDNPRDHYLASFPFFNRNNGLVYNLLHSTSNVEGFKLFKKTAWNVFGDKSSGKNTHGQETQMAIDLDNGSIITSNTDYKCLTVSDIAKYVYDKYSSRGKVEVSVVYQDLDMHPIFPSEGYKDKIKKELKEFYSVKEKKENGKRFFVFSQVIQWETVK